MRLGRLLPVFLLPWAISAVPTSARADDEACVAAVEDGLTLRKQEHLDEALGRLAVCMDPACPAEVRSVCGKRVAEVTAAIPTVVLVAKDGAGNDLVDVRVTVDGVVLTEKLDGRAWKMEPGPHDFTFEGPGAHKLTKRLVIGEGEKERKETVVLGPPPVPAFAVSASAPEAAPRPSWDGRRTAAIVSGAVGLVGLAVGGVFGLATFAKSREENSAGCTTQRCSTTANAQATTLHEAAVTDGLVSDIGFGVGAAGIVGAIALWMTAPHAASGARSYAALVSTTYERSGLGVQLTGSFE
jgi:hypothetical protein